MYHYSWNGSLISYDKTHFVRYPSGADRTVYTIPSPILSVDACAFYGADNLREIVIPASVRELDANAFAGCDNLEKITVLGDMPEITGGDALNLHSGCSIAVAEQ